MEQKCTRLISQTKEMEKNLSAAENAKKQAEETSHQIGTKLAKVQAEKYVYIIHSSGNGSHPKEE